MEKQSVFVGALQRMLMCKMPDDMRRNIEVLLTRENVSEYEYKQAYMNGARRLVLSRLREEIDWNPRVDAEKCLGCGACFAYCPHAVYEMRGGRVAVVNPTGCVILCHNCEPLCPAGAIAFPPQKDYAELIHYE